jgi:O-acetylhomoserine (thiol)-lyase
MEGGVATVCFATGMAAITTTLLSLLRRGDHVVSSAFLFGNTNSMFETLATQGIGVAFVDATDVASVKAALTPATRLVFVETIANPRTQIADLDRIGRLCAELGLIYVVVNALTKYIGGHGNALGGAVTDTGRFDWSRFSNIYDSYKAAKPALWGITQIRKKGLRDWGGSLSAEQAHHLAVGAETLALRMDRACANAAALAEFLAAHPRIRAVYYPGLPGHPQHALARELFSGYGALLSFELDPALDCFDFLNRLRNVVLSSNLGDTRTLAIPVAHTIYWEMGPERRASMGIAESLIRLSVGIEERDDLIADFAQALAG